MNRAIDNASMVKAIIVAVVAAIGVGACSSNGGPTDLSESTKARLADYCAKRDACQAELGVTVGPCPTSMCFASTTEEAALNEFFDCQMPKACSMFFSDDECYAAAGTSDAERDAFVTHCTAKASECGTNFGEACPIIGMPVIRKQLLREFDACLGLSCTDVQACWDRADEMTTCL